MVGVVEVLTVGLVLLLLLTVCSNSEPWFSVLEGIDEWVVVSWLFTVVSKVRVVCTLLAEFSVFSTR